MGGLDLSGIDLGVNVMDVLGVGVDLFKKFWLFIALGLGITLAPRLFALARAALSRGKKASA
jgi:hypothetical protein